MEELEEGRLMVVLETWSVTNVAECIHMKGVARLEIISAQVASVMDTSKNSATETQGLVEAKGVAGEVPEVMVPEVIMDNEVVKVGVTVGSVVVGQELTM